MLAEACKAVSLGFDPSAYSLASQHRNPQPFQVEGFGKMSRLISEALEGSERLLILPLGSDIGTVFHWL